MYTSWLKYFFYKLEILVVCFYNNLKKRKKQIIVKYNACNTIIVTNDALVVVKPILY